MATSSIMAFVTAMILLMPIASVSSNKAVDSLAFVAPGAARSAIVAPARMMPASRMSSGRHAIGHDSYKRTPVSSPRCAFNLHPILRNRRTILHSGSSEEQPNGIDGEPPMNEDSDASIKEEEDVQETKSSRYSLGLGKNQPLVPTYNSNTDNSSAEEFSAALNWNAPEPVSKPAIPNEQSNENSQRIKYDMGMGKNAPLNSNNSLSNLASAVGKKANSGEDNSSTGSDEPRDDRRRTTRHLLTMGDEESARLTKAVWDKGHFDKDDGRGVSANERNNSREGLDPIPTTTDFAKSEPANMSTSGKGSVEPIPIEVAGNNVNTQQQSIEIIDYKEIDLSVPLSVYTLGALYSNNTTTPDSQPVDLVWDLMRHEAQIEAAREPLLVSFLYSTILNHPTLESALAFHLANRLSSPAMLSTQIMSLIREALDADPEFRRNLRADILAVRDRDPACTCLPDVFLYFKGFHALQTYRVSHFLWKSGRRLLAHYLQSQVSQHFQIDIHPNATLGSGIMLDHGTGIVIGETAHLGHNCSVLHHVTLGGSGKKGVDRHPKVGNGVLLGAGASVLGNVRIGDGCQVGAGTLVIEDLPPGSVAVGVPAKIIGRFVDVTAQPSIGMNQLGSKESDENIVMYGMDGI